jgi:hypothetical protein
LQFRLKRHLLHCTLEWPSKTDGEFFSPWRDIISETTVELSTHYFTRNRAKGNGLLLILSKLSSTLRLILPDVSDGITVQNRVTE